MKHYSSEYLQELGVVSTQRGDLVTLDSVVAELDRRRANPSVLHQLDDEQLGLVREKTAKAIAKTMSDDDVVSLLMDGFEGIAHMDLDKLKAVVF